jgi:hypothetical protein
MAAASTMISQGHQGRRGLTVNDCVTSVAGWYLVLPPCDARIVHLPAATVLTVEPDTVHTRGVSELNNTRCRDDADADTVNFASINRAGSGRKEIVCGLRCVVADASLDRMLWPVLLTAVTWK